MEILSSFSVIMFFRFRSIFLTLPDDAPNCFMQFYFLLSRYSAFNSMEKTAFFPLSMETAWKKGSKVGKGSCGVSQTA